MKNLRLPKFTNEIPLAIEEEPTYGYETPWATYAIIFLNVAVYAITSAQNFFIQSTDYWISRLGFLPLGLLSDTTHFYRIFTAMFTHADILHILFNMYFLYLFGRAVERTMGHTRFVIHYLISGIFAAIIHTLFMYILSPAGLSIPSVGASGAISGVLGAYLLLYPGTRLAACMFFFIIPFCFELSAALWILFWFMLQVFEGFYLAASSTVAFFAHAGGFVAGIAFLPMFIDRHRLAVLKTLASARRLFGFIIFVPMYYIKRGLNPLTKTVLLVLISMLLIGSLTPLIYTKNFTTATYTVHWNKDGSEKAYLGVLDSHIITAGDTIDSKVLLDVLVNSGIIYNPKLAGREVLGPLIQLGHMTLQLGIHSIEAKYAITAHSIVYDKSGLMRAASLIVNIVTPQGGGTLNAKLELARLQNATTFIELIGLATLLVIIGSMIVVAFKDEELVITPE
ncbi:hypothetical protein PYJP_20050 [Pyrofollis japonicus]|uniref:rhomboid family intramembrane serine protease n=1 Tax=Pyrofollis japonicus TaxID=3060460 RepID=UPI00295ABF72|nr:rhomboid family intramembrane serine protease [Pyrofollis japonicus]BEP18653.1 hypothetical protein PYJP_20050 [Pyrofollis japonicus]